MILGAQSEEKSIRKREREREIHKLQTLCLPLSASSISSPSWGKTGVNIPGKWAAGLGRGGRQRISIPDRRTWPSRYPRWPGPAQIQATGLRGLLMITSFRYPISQSSECRLIRLAFHRICTRLGPSPVFRTELLVKGSCSLLLCKRWYYNSPNENESAQQRIHNIKTS